MARTNTRFKNAYNRMLAEMAQTQPGDMLPSELCISKTLGVSRTIVRSILQELDNRGVISWQGRTKRLRRRPEPQDRFSRTELTTDHEKLDRRFLEWVLRCDVAPETRLNIRELSSRFAVAPRSLNQFLASFSRFGLIERQGSSGWVLRGFTPEYATELFDFRMMVELDAARRIAGLPQEDPFWVELARLERDHLDLLARIDTSYHDFSELDDRFHSAVIGVSRNRFICDVQQLISLIFHYHYQWNKCFERQRNEIAIFEHLNYIRALRMRDVARIETAARLHLNTARRTLLDSTQLVRVPLAASPGKAALPGPRTGPP
ncbi:MAG TPA: GntR family transcriptional regulator [Pararhizobium sp.]|nr:GntR family transcriptional regulator [Pararhizobium sp.]